MRQLPKAIPELDGGIFVPRPVLELLEAVLADHERLLHGQPDATLDLTVLGELRQLLRLNGIRLPVPSARELLELCDPRLETIGRNLLRQ
ncbi:MAG: hypothetical protein RL522_1206 [Pseudomonadota bacterium]|jgi:hypothetical protein